jgi:hypothetical protein
VQLLHLHENAAVASEVRAGDVPFDHRCGGKYYNVNIACLDGVNIDELMAAPVNYADGRNDNWGATPVETRHI